MSLLSKTLNKLGKKPESSMHDEEAGISTAEFDYAKKNQATSNLSQDNVASVSSSTGHDRHVVIGDEKINISKLDFDITDIAGGEPLPGEQQFISINPVKSCSHHADIDIDKLNEKGFITPRLANSQLSNTYRMIKRPLLNNMMGKNASVVDHANLIIVTSSLAGEGKTFSAINLAMSIAMEKDKHVLLIDADVNKPSHPKIFGIETEYGLTDVLMGKVDDLSKALYKTNIASLTLMSSGTPTLNATELLASEDMRNFVQDVASRYSDRIVIFDSPPLLLTTEASVLASHMGQVVLVVEAEQTLRHQVKKSLSLLQNEIVLLLLNKMRDKSELGNYGYYGYGHGHDA